MVRGLVQAVKDLHLIHPLHQQGKINILDFPGKSCRRYTNRCCVGKINSLGSSFQSGAVMQQEKQYLMYQERYHKCKNKSYIF